LRLSESRAFWVLALCTAAAAGFRLLSLGFYNDDYVILATLERAGSTGLIRAFHAGFASFAARPLDLLYYPALFRVFGLHPWPYHIFADLLVLATAWNLYRLLRELEVAPPTALLAALLAALYPNHDATRNWLGGTIAACALAGTVFSMRFYARWLKSGSLRELLVSLAALIASALLYEAPVLLPLGLILVNARPLRRHVPLLAAIAAVLLYQRILSWLAIGPERHGLSLDPVHAFKVMTAGFECTFFNRLVHLVGRSISFAWADFSPGEISLLLLSCLSLFVFCRRLLRADPGAPPKMLLWLGLGFFVLGYAPYAFAARFGYVPAMFSESNRLNLQASLGGALIFAWCCARWRASGVPAALLLSAFLLATWSSNAQWTRAYSLQQEILGAVGPHLGRTAPKHLLIFGFPNNVGSATVFQSTYDFDGALYLRYRRPDLRGLVGEGRVRFEEDSAVLRWYGETPVPYDALYAYRHSDGMFRQIRDRQDGEAFLASAR